MVAFRKRCRRAILPSPARLGHRKGPSLPISYNFIDSDPLDYSARLYGQAALRR